MFHVKQYMTNLVVF